MSKELEALNRIKEIEIYKEEDYYSPDDERTIELSGYEYQGTVEEEYANEIDIIETALNENESLKADLLGLYQELLVKNKALKIIKEKRVNLEYLKCCKTYEQYCLICSYANEIDQEEYNLLKEVLL